MQSFPNSKFSRMMKMSTGGCREPVRRSLFGPVDHEQLRRDLELKLREISEQDSRRWNFCFQSETPLPGRFQWVEVPAERAPASHRDSAQHRDAVGTPVSEDADRLSRAEGSAGADQENCASISNTRKGPAEVTPVRGKRKLSNRPPTEPRAKARITDFFPKRRRSTETKSIMSPFNTGSSEAAHCRTIR